MSEVTVVGLGAMGAAIAGALLDAGRTVTVWNRTAAKGAGLTKVSVRTENGSLGTSGVTFPAVERHRQDDDYSVYLSSDIGPTVGAIIAVVDANGDSLIGPAGVNPRCGSSRRH